MSKGTKAKNEKETERDKERGKVMNGKGERQGKWEERRQRVMDDYHHLKCKRKSLGTDRRDGLPSASPDRHGHHFLLLPLCSHCCLGSRCKQPKATHWPWKHRVGLALQNDSQPV